MFCKGTGTTFPCILYCSHYLNTVLLYLSVIMQAEKNLVASSLALGHVLRIPEADSAFNVGFVANGSRMTILWLKFGTERSYGMDMAYVTTARCAPSPVPDFMYKHVGPGFCRLSLRCVVLSAFN